MVDKWRSAVRRLRNISLAVRNGEDNGPTKKEPGPTDLLLCDGEPPPSLEEIQSWGKSFDKLMRSTAGRKVFRDFLRCEYSEENILFWLACEELKRETNADAVEEKARFIYEDYISILSPKEVSLDSRVRELVNRNMVEPTPHTFDEAQLQIYTLMHRDSYPRFVNSPLYKNLAQVAGAGVGGNGNGVNGGGSGSGDGGDASPDSSSTAANRKGSGVAADERLSRKGSAGERLSRKGSAGERLSRKGSIGERLVAAATRKGSGGGGGGGVIAEAASKDAPGDKGAPSKDAPGDKGAPPKDAPGDKGAPPKDAPVVKSKETAIA